MIARPAPKSPWSWIQQRRGRTGLIAGAAAGAALTLALTAAIPTLTRPDEENTEDVELVIMTSEDESQNGQRRRLLDQWNRMHPDTQARFEEVSRSPEQAHAEMINAPANVDIYNLDVTWTAEFAESDRIRLLDRTELDRRSILEGFLEEPLSTCEYDGELYALPFNTDAGLLYYRTFGPKEQSWPPPPASWDDIATFGTKALTDRLDLKMEAGYAAQLDNAEILTITALEAIWAAGGDVVDQDGSVVIDSAAAERGLRHLWDGLAASKKPLILTDSLEFDEKLSTKAFSEGRVLMMRNWPVAYRELQLVTEENKQFRFDVTTVPGKVSVLGGQNLAVARTSKRPRAAQALIEYLTGERAQQILFEHGGFAATREIVYHDANITSKYPYAGRLLESIRWARARPATAHYTEFSREFRTVVLEVRDNGGEITPEHAQRLEKALQGKVGD